MEHVPALTPHRGSRQRLALCLVLCVALVAGLFSPVASSAEDAPPAEPQAPWSLEWVSEGYAGAPTDGDSDDPALSRPGGHVVFSTHASNLGPSPLPVAPGGNILVKDLATGELTQVNVSPSGGQLAYASNPDLSADGLAAVMSAGISGSNDVVLHDASTGVSTSLASFRPARRPSISDDTTRVAMVQADPDFADDDDREYVWVWDSGALTGVPVLQKLSDLPGLGDRAGNPELSGDGTTVVMEVRLSGQQRVQVVDVSDLSAVQPAETIVGGRLPSLSTDGLRVAYVGSDPATHAAQVRLLDRLTGEDQLVLELPTSSWVDDLQLAGDGHTVALVTGGTGGGLWTVDTRTGRTEAVYEGDVEQGDIDIAADGRTVVFSTTDDGVVPGDGNGMEDVFVARRTAAAGPAWPAGAALTVEAVSSSFATVAWPPAVDDLAVDHHLVTVDGTFAAQLPASATSHSVAGLSPETLYEIAVVAVDADGNASPTLRTEVYTEPRSTDPGTAPLALAAGPGGRIGLQWDPADGVEGYLVHRGGPDGELMPVAEVPADATSYVDEGLPAATELRYRVDAIVGGAPLGHTVEASATTPELTAAGTTWRGILAVGRALDLTVAGAPGWSAHAAVTYRSWFAEDGSELPEPRLVEAVVPLAEQVGTPGTYVGGFTLDEGVSEVTAIEGVVADGHGAEASASAARLPAIVRGALQVTIDAPAGSIPGGRAVIDGIAQLALDGGASWALPALAPGTRTLRVLSGRGNELAAVPVTILAGRRSELTVTPWLPADLTVRVTRDDGTALAGAAVTFRRGGEVAGTAQTDASGLALLPREGEVGEELVIDVVPPRALALETASATVTLESGANLVDLTVAPRARGVVRGTVTLDGSRPAQGARVVLSHTDAQGQSWTFGDVTGEDGRYEIEAFAGEGALTVGYAGDPYAHRSAVTIGDEPVTRDISLAVDGKYRVEIDLLTRTADDPTWRQVTLDPSTSIHFGMRVLVGGSPFPVGYGSVLVNGKPGDEIRVCGNGIEAGMTAGCGTTVLGEEPVANVELRLESAGEIRGEVVKDGLPVSSNSNMVSIQPIDPEGSGRSYPVHEGALAIPVPRAGTYRMSILLSGDGAATMTAASRIVTVGEGEIVDLGTVVLSGSGWATRSTLTPNRSTVVAGSDVELRASLVTSDWSDQLDTVAELTIPAGTSLVPGSVLLDGQPVEAAVVGDRLQVPLGTVSKAGAARVIRYRLSTDGVEPGTGLAVSAHVTSTSQGSRRTVLAAAGAVRVAGVTLTAPERSTTAEVNLSGLAPAGTTVRILDGNLPVGEAVAGPGGLWRMAAELPDLGNGWEHQLLASAEVEGTTLVSGLATVLVDDRFPVIESVSMVQNGRAVSFDPRQGVARFPFVFQFMPLEVELRFGGRGTPANVKTAIGPATSPAIEQVDGSFRSTIGVAASSLGSITADYDAVPAMAGPGDVPVLDEAQVRAVVPAPLSDFTGTTVTEDHDDAAGIRRIRVDSAAPSMGDGAELRSTLSVQRGLAYTPTAADLRAADVAGVPMYGLETSIVATADELSVEVSGYIAEELLGEPEGQSATGFAASTVALGVARVGFGWAFSGAQGLDSLYTAATTGDKYDRMNNLLDWVNRNCDDPVASRQLQGQLQNLLYKAAATDATHAALMVAGLAAAGPTLGIGTLGIWALTFAMDKLVDAAMDEEINEVVAFAQDQCENDEDPDDPWDPRWPDSPDPNDPLGDPTWIHDPSGYVFEAVPSNRVQGVTATLLYSESPDGPFEVWNADWFGQTNPLVTDAEGRYGWDVPEGFWQVVYDKAGYEQGRSEVLEVLPPHFDVNVGLRSTATPEVASVAATVGTHPAVTVRFSRYMRLDAGSRITVTRPDGTEVAALATPADGEAGPDGTFARTFELVPMDSIVAGEVLTVTVEESASSYAGIPLAGPWTGEVVVTEADETAPVVTAMVSPDAGGAGWHTTAPTVAISATDGDDGSGVAELRWTLEGAQTGSGSDASGAASVAITADGETTLRAVAVDAAGNESLEHVVVVRVDRSAPEASAVAPAPGAGGWHTAAPVAVALDGTDTGSTDGTGSGVVELRWTLEGAQTGSGTAAPGATVEVTAPGETTLRVQAVDAAGHVGPEASAVVRIDTTAPTATIAFPAAGATFRQGESATVDFSCADTGSGLATCTGSVADGAPLPTTTVGTHAVTVTAVDVAGHTTTATATYQVVEDAPAPDPVAMVDGLLAKVRSYGLSRTRSAVLQLPLQVARAALVQGQPLLACASLVTFEAVVDTYRVLRWLTPARAAELRSGSIAARAATGC